MFTHKIGHVTPAATLRALPAICLHTARALSLVFLLQSVCLYSCSCTCTCFVVRTRCPSGALHPASPTFTEGGGDGQQEAGLCHRLVGISKCNLNKLLVRRNTRRLRGRRCQHCCWKRQPKSSLINYKTKCGATCFPTTSSEVFCQSHDQDKTTLYTRLEFPLLCAPQVVFARANTWTLADCSRGTNCQTP